MDAPFAAVVVAVAVHGRVLLVDPRRSVGSGGRGRKALLFPFGGETLERNFGARLQIGETHTRVRRTRVYRHGARGKPRQARASMAQGRPGRRARVARGLHVLQGRRDVESRWRAWSDAEHGGMSSASVSWIPRPEGAEDGDEGAMVLAGTLSTDTVRPLTRLEPAPGATPTIDPWSGAKVTKAVDVGADESQILFPRGRLEP